jgi:uncharacterized protein
MDMPAIKDTKARREIERRVVGGEVRVVRDDSGAPSMLRGYAAVFNEETVIGSWFREVIAPGAFADVLTNDVRALFNHDSNIVLARTTNDTLTLLEDDKGLLYEIKLNPDDPDAIRVAAKVERGDVSQSSFAFWLDEDGEDWDRSEVKQGKLPLRTIRRVSQLDDVSPVTYPAYTGTSVSARAEQRARVESDTEEQDSPGEIPTWRARLRHARLVGQ